MFASSGLMARMPIAMTGIGIITMISQLGGTYWLAGTVAATFVFSMAILAPQISRAADRYGQSKILPPVTAISAVSMVCLLACTHYQLPNWTLYFFAIFSGFMPSIPAMSRARWSEIYRGTPKLHTAFSLETVLDEVCFIIGPPVSVGLSVTLFPQAGPLAAVVLLILGVSIFVLQKETEPPIYPQTIEDKQSVIIILPVQILTLALVALGVIVGTIDVISVAFAAQQGQPASASIVLSVYAIGSCLAGLMFGGIRLNLTLPKLFLYASLATALTALPLLFVSNILTLAISVFFVGLFFAPTMIIAMSLIENIVPSSKLTEGLTWVITGLGVGVAMGAALAGWVIDYIDIKAGFIVTLVAALIILAIAACSYKLMQRSINPISN